MTDEPDGKFSDRLNEAFTFDLNDRERKRFADLFGQMRNAAAEIAEALLARRDVELVLKVFLMGLLIGQLDELRQFVADELPKLKEKVDALTESAKAGAEFPSIIDE